MRPTPKPGILAIAPYRPGKAKAPGFARAIKLSANENPLGCSPAARAAYLEAADELHLYPDSRTSLLRAAISEKYQLEPERLVFGAGSDEVFAMACQAYLDAGDNIVQPRHGFAAWAIAARAAGGEVLSAPERQYEVDVDTMTDAVNERTRLVFVANPANPTGTCLPSTEIRRFHAGLPANVLLVLDGAYSECADGDDYSDGLDWSRNKENVLVTRTFSKIYGLASLRIGWAYAPAHVAETLNRIRLPFSISRAGEAAATAALADDDFVDSSVRHIREGRDRLARGLQALGAATLPSAANFITARFDEQHLSAADVESELARRGVLVRHLDGYGMPDFLRFSIGRADDTETLLNALGEVLGSRRR